MNQPRPSEVIASQSEFGYRPWTRRRRPAWLTCWSIARYSVWMVVRRKAFWVLLAMGLFHFLFYFAMIYLKGSLAGTSPHIERMLASIQNQYNGNAETYRQFMHGQELVTMLVLAFAGSIVVGNDHHAGGLTFYLSRRMNRWHYYVGKLLATSIVIASITTVPAIALYVEYGLLAKSVSYLWDNLRLLGAIIGYGACICVVISLLFFALAAWLQRTVPLLLTWAGIIAFLPAIAAILEQSNDNPHWMLLNLWHNMHLVGHWFFDTLPRSQEDELVPAVITLAAVAIGSFLVSLPRLRAVKVVT